MRTLAARAKARAKRIKGGKDKGDKDDRDKGIRWAKEEKKGSDKYHGSTDW